MIARRDFNRFRSTAFPRASAAANPHDPPAIGTMLGAVLARYGVTDAARVQIVHAPHGASAPAPHRFAPLNQQRLF